MDPLRKSDEGKIKGAEVKSVTLRRFMQISKLSPTAASVAASIPDLKALPSCHSSLENVMLKTRRNSEMRREMGIKHVRIQTPEEKHINCYVQIVRPYSRQKRQNVGVLRPAKKGSTVFSRRFPGPKIGEEGRIVPHSILGDVESFINEAKKRGDFEEIVKKQEITIKKHPLITLVQSSSASPCNTQLNEKKALENWEQEMFHRRMEQKRLASILKRPVGDLLMTRTDDMIRRNDIDMLMKQRNKKFHPDVCFWTLEPRYRNRQIMQTLTRTERGHPKTPCIRGEGATISKEKGKSDVSVSSVWYNPGFFEEKQQQEDSGGVIHIANQVLFKELEVCGHAISPAAQCNSMTNSLTSHCSSVCSRKMASSQLGSVHEEIMENEQFLEENGNPTCQISSRCEKKEGPSLCIGGTTLIWRGNIKLEETNQDRIAKEEFVLIEARVEEMAKSHMTFENNGTVVLKYLWKKLPAFHPLPIRRPVRRPFYCFDNAGSIRPGEILHIPVMFKSPIPGYFTESWLLDTVPVLENGAQIKFTLKGVAREVKDYTKQCLDIEEYLRKKKVETLCLLEAKYIVDSAIRLSYREDRDEPISLTRAEMFEETNPGFYFHEPIVKDLWIMMNIVSMDTKDMMDDSVLCISSLRKMIIHMPCPADDDEDEHFTRQNELFDSFCYRIVPLNFQPMFQLKPGFCIKHLILQTLLREGMTQFSHETYKIADMLGLILHEGLECPTDGNNSKWKNKDRNRAKVAAIGKFKSKDPTRADFVQDSVDLPQFSPLTKLKQIHGTKCKNLVQYEEKAYLMMYQILTGVLDTFDGFFVQ